MENALLCDLNERLKDINKVNVIYESTGKKTMENIAIKRFRHMVFLEDYNLFEISSNEHYDCPGWFGALSYKSDAFLFDSGDISENVENLLKNQICLVDLPGLKISKYSLFNNQQGIKQSLTAEIAIGYAQGMITLVDYSKLDYDFHFHEIGVRFPIVNPSDSYEKDQNEIYSNSRKLLDEFLKR